MYLKIINNDDPIILVFTYNKEINEFKLNYLTKQPFGA